jgi:hypothetical protein
LTKGDTMTKELHPLTLLRDRLPVVGPLMMAAALLPLGVIAARGGWPHVVTGTLLFAAGVGHAVGFSPLAARLTALVQADQQADRSGVILTADWVGTVLGVAAFAGIYLSGAPHRSAHALAITTASLAAALFATAACAMVAVSPRRAERNRPATPSTFVRCGGKRTGLSGSASSNKCSHPQ